MRGLIRRRLHGDESGATLVIVALCLIALVGMVVLVVDVGALLWNRREMVNASDAAALSAAKTCILPASKDPRSAEQAADEWALDNSSRAQTGVTNILQVSGCDTSDHGYVTVQYGANQQLFFGGIFGAGLGHITTQATAIWGPAGAGNPLPIVLYEDSFNNCKIKAQIDPTATCYVWEDNNNTSGAQAAFGLLDLRTSDPSQYGWNSNAGVPCPDPGNDPANWINSYPSNSVGDLDLNWPAATYVCRVSGLKQNAWSGLDRLIDDDDLADQNDEEDILLFPLNRCDNVVPGNLYGQLAPGGVEAPCSDTPHQFDIIGFVAMKLINVYDPLQVQGTQGSCKADRQMPGVSAAFSLDTFGSFNGCFVAPPDAIANVDIKKAAGTPNPAPVACPTPVADATCDWTYDAATRMVTWNIPGPARDNEMFEVSFDWQNGGACGIPPSGNNSGHCLILQPVEVRIGGSGPGGGSPNSNIRAYKLCEPAIAGSCSPYTVPIP